MKLVTSAEGVKTLTKQILKSDNEAGEGRNTYLQSLVLRTQKELGAEQRERSSRSVRLDDDGIKEQLTALNVAHEEFYAAVLEACSENLPGPTVRAKELNRRTNFARTALYSVRSWIRSGRDITALAAAKVTKGNIAVKRETTAPTPRRLITRVARGVTELIEVANTLAAQDKGAAVRELEAALGQISNALAALGVSATRDPALAMAKHQPLRTKVGTFFPINAPPAAP